MWVSSVCFQTPHPEVKAQSHTGGCLKAGQVARGTAPAKEWHGPVGVWGDEAKDRNPGTEVVSSVSTQQSWRSGGGASREDVAVTKGTGHTTSKGPSGNPNPGPTPNPALLLP